MSTDQPLPDRLRAHAASVAWQGRDDVKQDLVAAAGEIERLNELVSMMTDFADKESYYMCMSDRKDRCDCSPCRARKVLALVRESRAAGLDPEPTSERSDT